MPVNDMGLRNGRMLSRPYKIGLRFAPTLCLGISYELQRD